jgi:hypothetical protein
MARVKRRGLLYLVLTGTVMVVTGVVITMALLINRGDCSGVTPLAVCEDYTSSIHWAIPFFAVGAFCFVAAGLLTVRLMIRGAEDSTLRACTGESTD